MRDGRYDTRVLLLAAFSDGRGAETANRDLSSACAEAVERDLPALLGGVFPLVSALKPEHLASIANGL